MLTRRVATGVHFCIPLRNPAGQEHASYLSVDANQTAARVLEEIHLILGCEMLHTSSLPAILYHLSKDVKTRRFLLDDNGWIQPQSEWGAEVNKKGVNSLADLTLPPDVSHASILNLSITNNALVSKGPCDSQEA